MQHVRWRSGRYNGNEAVGGFLESILAVMVVITASSVFLVIISVGAVQERGSDVGMEDVIRAIEEQGLLSDEEPIPLEDLRPRFDPMVLPDGANGINLTYRPMGDDTPYLSLGDGAPEGTSVLGDRYPLLLIIDGRSIPAMLEVRVW
ncbi:MAG: hypothetical protein LUQ09_04005 [Methanomassiliicoccales archaeon]|nr:hypothetical protein [Methanomassiliicoccales archaeon]